MEELNQLYRKETGNIKESLELYSDRPEVQRDRTEV